MSTGLGAAVAIKRRNERDAADPQGAVRRNQRRALAAAIASAIWGGAALIVVTTVAPAAFRVLPTRSLAGALVGQVLPVLFLSGIVVGTLCFALVAPGAARRVLRRIGAAGVVAGCALAQFVIGPRIGALRERIGPSVESLAATDPLRIEFGRLHGLSVLALGVAMLFALLTLIAATLAVRAAPHDD